MAKKQPLYPHIPKSRGKSGDTYLEHPLSTPFREPTEREKFAGAALKVSEQLAYAYQLATMGYRDSAKTHVRLAIQELDKLGQDPEDLEPITTPLHEALEMPMHHVAMASHIDVAQHEFSLMAPRWITLGLEGKRNG